MNQLATSVNQYWPQAHSVRSNSYWPHFSNLPTLKMVLVFLRLIQIHTVWSTFMCLSDAWKACTNKIPVISGYQEVFFPFAFGLFTLLFFATIRNPRLYRIIGKFPHLWGSSVEKNCRVYSNFFVRFSIYLSGGMILKCNFCQVLWKFENIFFTIRLSSLVKKLESIIAEARIPWYICSFAKEGWGDLVGQWCWITFSAKVSHHFGKGLLCFHLVWVEMF